MKILILCNKLPYPANDGSSIAISKMIEGLSQDAEVSVLSLNTKKHYKDPENIPAEIRRKTHFTIVDVNTNPTSRKAILNLFQKLPFHVSRFFQAEVADKLKEVLLKENFDIIQIEGVFMMPYYHLIRETCSAKVVLRTHNIEYRIWERAIESTKKPVLKTFLKTQTRKLERYEKWCAQEADAVVSISEKDEEYFRTFNQNIITIPCGIDGVKVIDKVETQSFFHIGAMDWLPNQQGIQWLIDKVWPIVHEANKDLKLHLAGRAMEDKLLKLKVEGIEIHGEVKSAESFRKSHGIMLVPLLAGSGIRIKIIEGLAEGIPIISTRIGAEGIPATPGLDLLFADTASDFASAMLLLANNAEKRNAIGKNAAILAEQNFLNKNLAKKLQDFYSSAWQTS